LIGIGEALTYIKAMTDNEFDAALVCAAFALAGEQGWRKLSVAAAARHAGLDLAQARIRFPRREAILKHFGAMADNYALTGAAPVVEGSDSSVKDRLFDLLLRRFDFLQTHRAGVVALLRYAPMDPALSAWLAVETTRSMGWLLEGAGVSEKGVLGELRKRGLAAVWAWGLRAWWRDETEDLSATMVAVDVALSRADQIASRLNWAGAVEASPEGDGFVPEIEPDTAMAQPGAPEAGRPELDEPPFPPVSPPG
jgi:ubiquinone biosynthesis protein COQ9